MPFPFMAFGTGVLGVPGVLWWLGGWVVGWLAFGTGEGLLGYRICVPCSKWLPGVRDAFSEAFGVKNRLLCLSLKKVDSQQRVNNGVFTHPETVQLL